MCVIVQSLWLLCCVAAVCVCVSYFYYFFIKAADTAESLAGLLIEWETQIGKYSILIILVFCLLNASVSYSQ